MAREILRLTSYHYGTTSKPPRYVEVEYGPADHWASGTNAADRPWRAYAVTVDGVEVGRVEQTTQSIDRHYGRIRLPGRGRVAWQWRRADGTREKVWSPEATRSTAVARMLGYDFAEKITESARAWWIREDAKNAKRRARS